MWQAITLFDIFFKTHRWNMNVFNKVRLNIFLSKSIIHFKKFKNFIGINLNGNHKYNKSRYIKIINNIC